MEKDIVEVTIVLNSTRPLSWTIEAVNSDNDGGIDVTVFSGPTGEARAREYARWKYAAFAPDLVAA